MTTVYRADIVGSLLRPDYLVRARAQFESREMAPAIYKEIEDRAVEQAIAMQEGAGMDVVTDGELRRHTFIDQLLEAVVGLTPDPRAARATTSRSRSTTRAAPSRACSRSAQRGRERPRGQGAARRQGRRPRPGLLQVRQARVARPADRADRRGGPLLPARPARALDPVRVRLRRPRERDQRGRTGEEAPPESRRWRTASGHGGRPRSVISMLSPCSTRRSSSLALCLSSLTPTRAMCYL